MSDYAIVDVTKGRASRGKILVLLDDEETAEEIALGLRDRGCTVVVEAFVPNRSPAPKVVRRIIRAP